MKKRVKQKQEVITRSWNLFSVLGFIFAFLSWFSVLGIALSMVGIIETKRKKQKGRILAIAGLIVGIIVLVLKAYGIYFF